MLLDNLSKYKVDSMYPWAYSTEYTRNFKDVKPLVGILKDKSVQVFEDMKETPKVNTSRHKYTNRKCKHEKKKKERTSVKHEHKQTEATKLTEAPSKTELTKTADPVEGWQFMGMVAGNSSSTYHRGPFIQHKKKVAHLGDCLVLGDRPPNEGFEEVVLNRYVRSDTDIAYRSEPSLQKKKISLYSKNHNILRTNTVQEVREAEEAPLFENRRKSSLAYKVTEDILNTKKDKSIKKAWSLEDFHRRKVYSEPEVYVTSYKNDFTAENHLQPSAMILANRRHAAKQSNQHLQEALRKRIESPVNVIPLEHKETEYEKEFQTPFQQSLQPMEKVGNCDDDFLEYYQRVLEDRYFSYNPVLLDKIEKERAKIEEKMRRQTEEKAVKLKEQSSPKRTVNPVEKQKTSPLEKLKPALKQPAKPSSLEETSSRTSRKKQSVCSQCSYDSRYSLSYNPSLYSDSTDLS